MVTTTLVLDPPNDRTVTLHEICGLSRDAWCEPVVRMRFTAHRTIRVCQFVCWLKPEPDRDESTLRLRFGDEEPCELTLPHDRVVTVHAACRAEPGEVVDGLLECDNDVTEKGADVRPLSFRLERMRFR